MKNNKGRKKEEQHAQHFAEMKEGEIICNTHSTIACPHQELGNRGYDVIHKTFFVEISNALNKSLDCRTFEDFKSYYNFINGDIYNNACYYQYNFSRYEINTYHINLNEINTTALIDTTFRDFPPELSQSEMEHYYKIEKRKELHKEWIAKFNSCSSYEEFEKTVNELSNIYEFSEKDFIFYISNFIFADKDNAYDIVMQYIAQNMPWGYSKVEKILCFVYGSQKVLNEYKYDRSRFSTREISKHRAELKEYIRRVENHEIQFREQKFFDENTHFFCYKTVGDEVWYGVRDFVQICRYFDSFYEFANYLNNDLSDCDLSKAILPNIDFSCYQTNEHTKLPLQYQDNLTHVIIKEYDKKTKKFVVTQKWVDKNSQVIKENTKDFDYFFDFVFFLENDLSDANLLFCEGLRNLHDVSNINFTNAKLRSDICDKFGITYEQFSFGNDNIENFSIITKNEEETSSVLSNIRNDIVDRIDVPHWSIYYISDLHLMHRLKKVSYKSKDDIIYFLEAFIESILIEINDLSSSLLIGGDTASDFDIFKIFVQLLGKSVNSKYIHVIFLLGNHELWGFPNESFEGIVQKYENVITSQGMYLLQNDIIYFERGSKMRKIATQELLSMSKKELRIQLNRAKLILFGGLAFSGYNKEFNACNGIYRSVIDRNQEIAESKKFENLYKIVATSLSDHPVVVFTHTPKADWCSDSDYQAGFVYVSGHTHRNFFYDDGENRIYSDNQMGYRYVNAHLKYFTLKITTYDCFSEYEDGIYEITKQQYIDFYRGKNIPMTFTQDINILYMLKKKGYYCFIHQSENKALSILNGGRMKKLNQTDPNYYYERMDIVISQIKNPLDKYTSIQQKIANTIKAIGGQGNIHGTIIDIDYHNHIYVNPYDLKITGYWAENIVKKVAFPSIPRLLKESCPDLYQNYLKLDGQNKEMLGISDIQKQEINIAPQIYLDTDIYKASWELTKMQRLNKNILTTWSEPARKKLE